MQINEAIAELESIAARIRSEWSEFEVGPHHIFGGESLLDDLITFVAKYPDIDAHKVSFMQFDASGGSFLAAFIKAKQGLTSIAVALVSFVGLRKCRLTIKLKGQEISVEAASAEEMERLLRVADQLFIHPSGSNRNT